MADRVNQRFGDYLLMRFLGGGTFGDVYLGEHIYNKTQVAVKVFKTKLTLEKVKDFINEVSTLLLLKHPNIVQLLHFGIGDHDIPYLVMEYAPNGVLLERHPRGTRLPLPTVVTYVKQIAAALQYAHDQRRIHRDVKPENMLFGAKNEIVLSDFGIAVVAHSTSSQRTEDSIGTAVYMAYEQWQGKPLPASDQYALGIIVYEWLCGETPFKGSTLQLMYQHIHDAPPPLRGKLATIPVEVEQVVMTALAKDPQQRFRSVQAFANALEQAGKPKAPSRPTIGTTLLTYRGHSGHVNTVAWSPDGRLIASGSDDKTIQVWDATMGATIGTYHGHSASVKTVAWAPDGKRIASGSKDKTVQVWDITTGAILCTYRGHSDWVEAVAWSPDGRFIASGSDDKTVQVWDAATGGNVYTYRGHSGSVNALVWSPDGKHIASSGSWDKTVQVWDAATGGNVYTYRGHSGSVNALAWSPDGKHIASASVGVQIWDAATGERVLTYQGHVATVNAVSWSSNSRDIFSASSDYTVQVWNATTGNRTFTYTEHSGMVTALALSPDGKRVASGNGGYLWIGEDGDTGASCFFSGHPDWESAVKQSPNGRRIPSSTAEHGANTDYTVHVWQAV